MSTKRLYRSVRDRRIAGVAGGMAEYFAVDVTLIRLLWILAVIFGGSGILAYIIAWIVIPDQPTRSETETEAGGGAPSEPAVETIDVTPDRSSKISYVGIFLILLGIFFLIRTFIPWHLTRYFWPLLLVLLGIALLVPNRRRS
ncbi:phage shock protein C (PspC) family protein [Hydrogenispora ethanolica]|jgi:phage shock protein PspC (stress-responsive transcriptional regulator)|uniref:Phage shock protein C (PspC) family protein n=1 Tax=Hydrogenispora ethanolica TaxID=1082276 RepID=A0A4R1SBI2_HYDET|nr:PspC domain-containing protein [Hydrogenispora ethanolica]TCL76848.1 phage shock protein C (PspC) family protein [Hydrogenispora ethanolica]